MKISKQRHRCFDGAIARPIWQGQGLEFSLKDQMFKDNKLFTIQHFALFGQACNLPVGIMGEQCLRTVIFTEVVSV